MKSPAHQKRTGSIPKPATLPAKRKRGPGQPPRADPRTRTLPRVTESTHTLLTAYAAAHDCFLADAIEAAARALSHSPALAACRSIIFAGKQAKRHGGEYSLPDLQAAEYLAAQALATL